MLCGKTERWPVVFAGVLLALCKPDIAHAGGDHAYVVRFERWTEADERGYGEFIRAIGDSRCNTVHACLRSAANPFRASDPPWLHFRADCADLPYYLRAYYAWKRGLPFSYADAVQPRGRTRDIRYSARGNAVVARRDVLSYSMSGPELLDRVRDTISSAMYRIHPHVEAPLLPDHYPVAVTTKSIRPGTTIYDPNGHLAVVYRVERDGRVRYIDSHPDNTLTRGTYDKRFVRSSPGMGAGFKNWRPLRLVGAARGPRGEFLGGRVAVAENSALPDFSDEQFFGTGAEKPADRAWASGHFRVQDEALDYYDFVRARLAGGVLRFNPVEELRNMLRSNCEDLHYRAQAVEIAIAAGIHERPHPARLPFNIYGTEGDWETYSTPSRDARLKTAFKEVRDDVERFLKLHEAGDPKVNYKGHDLTGELLETYDRETSACSVTYRRSDGSIAALSYAGVVKRLFAMSFDPYHCVEFRWGASAPHELRTCKDNSEKRAWYAAEQNLRNQIERTYEARMDHGLVELAAPGGEGKGVSSPPGVDVRAFLLNVRKKGLPSPPFPNTATPSATTGALQ
ncbi:MAG: hypothetical protein ACT4OG_09440 [Alphaproteobacteria bacterium]